jgi:hypothetical protein
MLDDAARASLESSLIALKGSLKSSVKALNHEALRGPIESIFKALNQDPRMIDIIDTHQALNTLEGVLELPKTSLAQVLNLQQDEKLDDASTFQHGNFDDTVVPEGAQSES